jgi:hypothetical protein
MEQVMNNVDLIRLIYSFGYPKHRQYMKCIVNQFACEEDVRRFNMECIMDDWVLYFESQYYPSAIDMFLSDLFNSQQQKALLRQMIKCKCCTRHSHNKPILLNDRIIYYPTTIKHKRDPYCNCNCRSLSRSLWFCYKNHMSLNRLKDSQFYRSPNEIYY